jgi:hypothetical protein
MEIPQEIRNPSLAPSLEPCLQVHPMHLTSSTQQVLLLQHSCQVLSPAARRRFPPTMWEIPKKWEGHGEIMQIS